MRIAFVYDGIYPFTVGGLSKRIRDIAEKLSERGHEVHLYGMRYWDGPRTLLQNGLFIHGVCPTLRRYAGGGRRTLGAALAFAYGVFKVLMRDGPFDIVDSGMAPIVHQPSAFLGAKAKARGFVITCVEVWADYWYDYLGTFLGGVGLTAERLLIRLGDLILAISEKIRDDLIALGLDAKRIRVVENGVDFKRIQRIRPVEEDYDVVFVGRLIPHKRVDLLLRALRELKAEVPDVRCAIVGDGPERRRLEKKAKELGLVDNVHFIGFLPSHDDVIAYMKAAKIFVLPSVREGFPNTILEANACGLPALVVMYPKNAGAWVVRDGENGFRCKLSERDIASKIRLLLSDRALLLKLRQRSLAFARAHDWDIIIDRLEMVYKELL